MTSQEAVERFRAVHLQGQVERSVYTALTLAPSEYWSPLEIAGQVGADDHVVGAVLRQFAAAGVVDVESVASEISRCRVRPTSLFLPEQPAGAAIIDPVCGMRVEHDSPFVFAGDSAPVRFCSQRCLLVWERRVRDADAQGGGAHE